MPRLSLDKIIEKFGDKGGDELLFEYLRAKYYSGNRTIQELITQVEQINSIRKKIYNEPEFFVDTEKYEGTNYAALIMRMHTIHGTDHKGVLYTVDSDGKLTQLSHHAMYAKSIYELLDSEIKGHSIYATHYEPPAEESDIKHRGNVSYKVLDTKEDRPNSIYGHTTIEIMVLNDVSDEEVIKAFKEGNPLIEVHKVGKNRFEITFYND